VQLLVPVHVDVQFELQVLWQVDWASHVVVHPVPQVEAHVFFVSQLYVTLLGAVAAASAEPSGPPSALPPKVQCPPAAHVHVLPVHEQSPAQVAVAPPPPPSGPPSSTLGRGPVPSGPASMSPKSPASELLPHPLAIAALEMALTVQRRKAM
jgi:hypothetical protein